MALQTTAGGTATGTRRSAKQLRADAQCSINAGDGFTADNAAPIHVWSIHA
jgi:hypothetical protein